ncbi:50S ribosomal protein L6 [Candidatus Gracilibacteria bacterium]|nr:MAG: 50S ribosomal protein L6 [Candidatus Gracilibacteria bacterium]
MSRIGKQAITLPAGVNVEITDAQVSVTGNGKTLTFPLQPTVKVVQEENQIIVSVDNPNLKEQRAFWGLSRSIIQNMVTGLSEGYTKSLEIVGVGYKFDLKSPKNLELSIGYSHKVPVEAPEGIDMEVDKENKNIIHLKSHDKQLLGYFAAYVRSLKKPEPYKGKGIKYVGEYVRRKAGKTATK